MQTYALSVRDGVSPHTWSPPTWLGPLTGLQYLGGVYGYLMTFDAVGEDSGVDHRLRSYPASVENYA